MFSEVRSARALALAALLMSATVASGESPPGASAWVEDTHSSLRLVAGSRQDAHLLGGLDIKLQPGWKTYWRTPGDSGVPPRFDFSASTNVDGVEVLWPAPEKFPDGAGGFSYGYHDAVLLPLKITPKEPGKPVVLRADISYAVCAKLCVPVEARSELAIDGVPAAHDARIQAALASLPRPANPGDGAALAIRTVHREGDKVVVDVRAEANTTPDLFAEGPTADWSLPMPEVTARQPDGTLRYGFALDGLPPGAKAEGAELKFTLVGKSGSYEYRARLD